MPTAVLQKKKTTTRVYIEGKGVVTRGRIIRQAWLNQRAARRGKPLITQLFRTSHGSDVIGVQIMSVRGKIGERRIIKGFTVTGGTFTGSYDFKIGCGPIDIA